MKINSFSYFLVILLRSPKSAAYVIFSISFMSTCMKIDSFSYWDLEYYLLRSPFKPTAYMYVKLFLLYHLWVLVHLNYRDIKQLSHKGGGGGGGSQAPQDHPLATSTLVYGHNKT